MMCSILKGGSNSWKIFMQRVYDKVQETGATLDSGGQLFDKLKV